MSQSPNSTDVEDTNGATSTPVTTATTTTAAPSSPISSDNEDITTLEEEVALLEATLSTLKSKLENIDDSIGLERDTLSVRKKKLDVLKDRKIHLQKSFTDQEAFVKKVEAGLKKCVEELKKKLEVVNSSVGSSNNANSSVGGGGGGVVVTHAPPQLRQQQQQEQECDDEEASCGDCVELSGEEEATPHALQTNENASTALFPVTAGDDYDTSKADHNEKVDDEKIDDNEEEKVQQPTTSSSVISPPSPLSETATTQQINNEPKDSLNNTHRTTLSEYIPAPPPPLVREAVIKPFTFPTAAVTSSSPKRTSSSVIPPQRLLRRPVLIPTSHLRLEKMVLVQVKELIASAIETNNGHDENVYASVLTRESVVGTCLDPLSCLYHHCDDGATARGLPLQWEEVGRIDATSHCSDDDNDAESTAVSDDDDDAAAADLTPRNESTSSATQRPPQSPPPPHRFDPHAAPLCPYEMNGICRDAECTFQHLTARPTTAAATTGRKRRRQCVRSLPPSKLLGVPVAGSCLLSSSRKGPREEDSRRGGGETRKRGREEEVAESGVATEEPVKKVCRYALEGTLLENAPTTEALLKNYGSTTVSDGLSLVPPVSTNEPLRDAKEMTAATNKAPIADETTKEKETVLIPPVKRLCDWQPSSPMRIQREKEDTDNAPIALNNAESTNDDVIEWDGGELDFIPLPNVDPATATITTTLPSPSQSSATAKNNAEPLSFWWSLSSTLSLSSWSNNAVRIPLSNYLSLHGFVFSRSGKRVDDDSDECATTTISIRQQQHDEPKAADGICYLAQCVDGMRVCAFSGRFDIALALWQVAASFALTFSEEPVPEVGWMMVLLNGVKKVLMDMACATPAELFCGNVTLALVAEWIFEYHLCKKSLGRIGNDVTKDDEKEWLTVLHCCLMQNNTKDRKDKILDEQLQQWYSSLKVGGGSGDDVETLEELKKVFSAVFTLQKKTAIPTQPLSASVSSSSNSPDHDCASNSTTGVKRLMRLLRWNRTGKQLGQFLLKQLLSFSASKRKGKQSHLQRLQKYQVLVVSFLETLGTEVKHYSTDLLDQDKSFAATALTGYAIFSAVATVVHQESLPTHKNSDDLFLVNDNTNPSSTLATLEGTLRRTLFFLSQTVSSFPSSFKLHELLLSPLIATNVAVLVQLSKYHEAQMRLEKALLLSLSAKKTAHVIPASDNKDNSKINNVNNNVMIYSDLLWSQILLLRMHSVSIRDMKQSLNLARRVMQFDVHPCHVSLIGDLWGCGDEGDEDDASLSSIREAVERSFLEDNSEQQSCQLTLRKDRQRQHAQRFILPTSIMLVTRLTKLDVSHVGLTFLPLTIGTNLVHLTEINVSHNKLTTLPPSLTLLSKLSVLDISFNELPKLLDDSIGKLSELTELHASNNKIGELPESLCLCRKLRVLDVSGNEVTVLPRDLALRLDRLIDFRL